MAVRNIRKQLAGVEDLLLGKGKQDQERSSRIVSITKIDIPAIVETIDELSLVDINKYTTAIVKDIDRGGTFIYIASNLAINNGGTIFNGWTRQYSGAANVKWFGAQGDAAPTSGTWSKGVVAWNLNPSAGGFIGWVCVASGTPGTWKPFGAISA